MNIDLTVRPFGSGHIAPSKLSALALAISLAYALGASDSLAQTPPVSRAPLGNVLPKAGAATSALPTGGNVVQGARAPVVNQQTMTIEQTAPRAIINWDTFNIGAGSQVRFNQQGNADWAILNRVTGTERSVLQGLLQADGQVYLLNRNGILIGKGAQVNVNSFIASTLSISDKVFKDGLLSVGGVVPALVAGTGDQAPAGSIRIEPGAVITSADGGKIYFIASGTVYDANGTPLLDSAGQPVGLVENQGTLRAPNGQVILAAGDRVFFRTPNTSNPKESNLAGLVIDVDAGGQVVNGMLGFIQSKLGNISMVGMIVNQMGRVSATTSVDRNGSIWLLAKDGAVIDTAQTDSVISGRGGKLTLGAQSITSVVPDLDSANRTSLDAAPFVRSQLRLEGRAIQLQGQADSGAQVLLPSGNVQAVARTDFTQAATLPLDNTNFDTDGSFIAIDRNVKIDVAGLRGRSDADGRALDSRGVPVAMERNSVRIELRGEQLADAPVLRQSPIRSQAIYVDARRGTTLINQQTVADAIASQTQRDIFERSTVGGSVLFDTTGSAVLQNGASINLSGGAIAYGSGTVRTSRLFDGRNYFSVTNAPDDRVYTRITDSIALNETGYLEGRAAGSINISARNLILQSQVLGGTITGIYQRNAAPYGGSLQLTSNLVGEPRNRDSVVRHGLVLTDNASNTLPPYLPNDDSAEVKLSSTFGSGSNANAQQIDIGQLAASGLSSIQLQSFRNPQV
jgi:filamentous hemagglutinin